jgi:hypothetical protein
MTTQKFRLRFDVLRHPKIVSIKECDKIPLAARTPVLRAPERPRFSCLRYWIRLRKGSSASSSFSVSGEPYQVSHH